MGEHHYDLTVTWTGNRGTGTSGYRDYDREHTVSAAGRPDIAGSADPTFHGDASRWNPEQLLVAALSECHLLSFLHLCSTNGVVVLGYVDEPVGTMSTNRGGGGQFTEVVLRPRVTVAAEDQVAKAEKLHAKANELCFIASSVNFPVHHAPETVVTG